MIWDTLIRSVLRFIWGEDYVLLVEIDWYLQAKNCKCIYLSDVLFVWLFSTSFFLLFCASMQKDFHCLVCLQNDLLGLVCFRGGETKIEWTKIIHPWAKVYFWIHRLVLYIKPASHLGKAVQDSWYASFVKVMFRLQSCKYSSCHSLRNLS